MIPTYNRYIPQPDGSYRRSRIPDTAPAPKPTPAPEHNTPKQESAPPEPQPKQPTQRSCVSCPRNRQHAFPRPQKQEQHSNPKGDSIGNFLRQLLPKDFDTGDLLVVLLLLLMAGDCAEEQNSALLTLVLYLFM